MAKIWEEGAGATITPSWIGGLGSKSLWVLEPSFTTCTHKRKKRQDILSGGYILGRVGSVLDRWGWRMKEGGDGFEEALDWGGAAPTGLGLLRLLGGVEKVFERLRTILSRGDAFVGVLAL